MPSEYDFKNIAPHNGGQRDAFEEFCCQIFRLRSDVPAGAEFQRFRGAGGDGGVECLWLLPDGSEWGMQAKHVFVFKQLKSQLGKSIQAALSLHPRLTRYVICIPFNLTAPTGRGGGSQQQRFQEWQKEWAEAARAKGMNVSFELNSASSLFDDLLSSDPHGGRRLFWFEEAVLGDSWFQQHLKQARAAAGPRYTPELNIQTALGTCFEALGRTKHWHGALERRRLDFRRISIQWMDCLGRSNRDSLHPSFPDAARASGESVKSQLELILRSIAALAGSGGSPEGRAALQGQVAMAMDAAMECQALLRQELEERFGEGKADSPGIRQFCAEYECSFPAANYDTAKELASALRDLAEWLESAESRLPYHSVMLLTGDAGIGKTHAILDAAHTRLERGLRSVVTFGGRFGVNEPWETLRQCLGLAGDLSCDAMFAALDSAGEASGFPLLVFIDALNETQPRSFWCSSLASLAVQLARYPHLRLCVSCRTSYLSQVLPERDGFVEVVHHGFEGLEFDACKAYFEAYALEPPVTPVLHPEFSNPLFLRLVCEAMKSAGERKLPKGWRGLAVVVKAFMSAKNADFARKFDVLENDRTVTRAVDVFVRRCGELKTSVLSLSEARKAISAATPPHLVQHDLVNWLIREGLFLVDAAPAGGGDSAEDIVKIAFERLGDHLLANALLQDMTAKGLDHAIQRGGLAFLFSSREAMESNAGLIEALCVQIPERFAIEMPDCLRGSDHFEYALDLAVKAVLWRDPTTTGQVTALLVEEALTSPNTFSTAMDVAVSSSTMPESALNSRWLYSLLNRFPMGRRDEWWCGYLHQSFEDSGPVKRLTSAAFEPDVTRVEREVALHWVATLSWFFAAADRRVRDQATKAAIHVTLAHPDVWPALLPDMLRIDDDYIVERCLVSAYGAMMLTRNRDAVRDTAAVVYREVFADSRRFQNASIRDHARCILELAEHIGVRPSGVDVDQFRPPYKSDWPLTIPSDEDVNVYEDSKRYPRLHFSCLHDDFFVKVLPWLTANLDESASMSDVARWILKHSIDLGYHDGLAFYDRQMVAKYGPGRTRPTWAERIGKKYQWIGLARLVARLTDHCVLRRGEWDPVPVGKPLAYLRGRDIDPSFLIREARRESCFSWWLPTECDLGAKPEMGHEEWLDGFTFPNTLDFVRDKCDFAGNRWMLLEAHPQWSTWDSDATEDHRFRRAWFQIRSYLIRIADMEKCWRWLRTANLYGRWMPEGPEFYEEYFGEYPWGVPYNTFPDRWYGRCHERETPVEVVATTCQLGSEWSRDGFQEETIWTLAPARVFFDDGPLWFDGRKCFVSSDRRPLFIDPSLDEPGSMAFLVDATHLQRFLTARGLAMLWTVLGESAILGDHSRGGPRPKILSQVHIMDPHEWKIRSSKPLLTRE